MTGQWGSVNGLLTSIDLLTLTLTTLFFATMSCAYYLVQNRTGFAVPTTIICSNLQMPPAATGHDLSSSVSVQGLCSKCLGCTRLGEQGGQTRCTNAHAIVICSRGAARRRHSKFRLGRLGTPGDAPRRDVSRPRIAFQCCSSEGAVQGFAIGRQRNVRRRIRISSYTASQRR